MFEKMKIQSQIKKCTKQISALEQKRVRSQGALVEAILRHSTPSDEDVDYFNRYTEEIKKVRDEMHKLQLKLKQL